MITEISRTEMCTGDALDILQELLPLLGLIFGFCLQDFLLQKMRTVLNYRPNFILRSSKFEKDSHIFCCPLPLFRSEGTFFPFFFLSGKDHFSVLLFKWKGTFFPFSFSNGKEHFCQIQIDKERPCVYDGRNQRRSHQRRIHL